MQTSQMCTFTKRKVVRLALAAAFGFSTVGVADAADIRVGAGGDLQSALNAAQPGDTILLAAGAEFVGNFVLPVKNGDQFITLRSDAPDTRLSAEGVRIAPADAPFMARLRSANTASALRTAAGAHHWRLEYLEFAANRDGYGDILAIGDGSNAQSTLASVPRQIVLAHLYVHGDPLVGQKRCIALNAAAVTIRDSYIADCKTVGQDSQAIAGWNGPGPYLIENNYLEGAGENVLLGGSDPAIANLVADGVTFRRNYVSRPMAWRSPIVAPPESVTAVGETGGALPAGTYSYRIIARRPVGQGVMGRSTASTAAAAVVTVAGGAVRVRWQGVPGATEYRVYGRLATGQAMYWTATGTGFVDDGGVGVAEAVPTSAGTVWLVKNLFELKNARNVVVEQNIFENHWKDAQAGYAIVLTPRNSGNACTWCVVENVRFEFNVLRNVSAGFNILGYDSPEVTRQSRYLTIRNNVVHGVRKSLGGNGWFVLVGDEPRDLMIDHNTIDHDGSTLVNVYGGTATSPRQITGFTLTNNAARHGYYGMGGSFFAYGNEILARFYPGAVFAGNYLAGGTASRYPANNLFSGTIDDQFVDASGGNFTLRPSSALQGAATDGLDVGADMATLMAGLAGVVEGTGAAGVRRPAVPSGVRIGR